MHIWLDLTRGRRHQCFIGQVTRDDGSQFTIFEFRDDRGLNVAEIIADHGQMVVVDNRVSPPTERDGR